MVISRVRVPVRLGVMPGSSSASACAIIARSTCAAGRREAVTEPREDVGGRETGRARSGRDRTWAAFRMKDEGRDDHMLALHAIIGAGPCDHASWRPDDAEAGTMTARQ